MMKDNGFESVRRMLIGVEKGWYSEKDKSRFRHYMPKKWAVS
jgi:hypothetical protein